VTEYDEFGNITKEFNAEDFADLEKVFGELIAYVNGFNAENPAYAKKKFANAFLDFDSFIAALDEMNKATIPGSESNAQYSREFTPTAEDTAYLNAVNSGDMETAQKMVDEAAKKAGYTIEAYHGTTEEFNEFFPGGVYFTDDYWNADGYASGERVIDAYLKIQNPLVIDAQGAKWDDLNSKYGNSTREIVGVLAEKYDGVIFENINDSWIDDENADESTVYWVRESAQAKSADPVTYDYNGNVIPLSERFNEKNEDIRYSREFDADLFDVNEDIRKRIADIQDELAKNRNTKALRRLPESFLLFSSKRILGAEFLKMFGKGLLLDLLDIAKVFVGIEGVGLELYHRQGDVGAVVGNALIIRKQIVEREALLERADALLQAVHMVELELVAQRIDYLLERLYLCGAVEIVIDEGINCNGNYFKYGALHDLELMRSLRRIPDALVVYFLRDHSDVEGVVGKSLKIGESMKKLGYFGVLVRSKLVSGYLHEVGADAVFKLIGGCLESLGVVVGVYIKRI